VVTAQARITIPQGADVLRRRGGTSPAHAEGKEAVAEGRGALKVAGRHGNSRSPSTRLFPPRERGGNRVIFQPTCARQPPAMSSEGDDEPLAARLVKTTTSPDSRPAARKTAAKRQKRKKASAGRCVEPGEPAPGERQLNPQGMWQAARPGSDGRRLRRQR